MCNLLLQQFSFLYFQSLNNDCSHIEDVQLLFCAHFILYYIFEGNELRHYYVYTTFGVLILCNLKRQQFSNVSFLFKLCILFYDILKIYTIYFDIYFLIFLDVERRHTFTSATHGSNTFIYVRNTYGMHVLCLFCVSCNANSFHSQFYINFAYIKVRMNAKISNRYNQVPHLTQDTTWKRSKARKKTSHTLEPGC